MTAELLLTAVLILTKKPSILLLKDKNRTSRYGIFQVHFHSPAPLISGNFLRSTSHLLMKGHVCLFCSWPSLAPCDMVNNLPCSPSFHHPWVYRPLLCCLSCILSCYGVLFHGKEKTYLVASLVKIFCWSLGTLKGTWSPCPARLKENSESLMLSQDVSVSYTHW